MAGLSQKTEGDIYPDALHARCRVLSAYICVVDQQKWTDEHAELPEGYLVYPSSKVSVFPQSILGQCTSSNSKDPLGAVKSAIKALRHLRACQVGIPEEGTEFPSQPYIAGVTSRAKTATAEARQWSVVVCWQIIVALHPHEV